MTHNFTLRKILDINTLGRDFVIGDLHGCYDRLQTFLEFVNFNYELDRIISVSDLIDRGPKNLECLKLLNESWFHCVVGNHEQMMYEAFNYGEYGQYWPQNGGKWGLKYLYELDTDEAKEVRRLVAKIGDLPLCITVPMVDGRKFHVIHAELDSFQELSDKDFDKKEPLWEAAHQQSLDGSYILWGRNLYLDWYCEEITEDRINKYKEHVLLNKSTALFGKNLSHIYSGHSIVTQPLTIAGQTNLDTGAYLSHDPQNRSPWSGLTATEPLTGKFWITNAEGTKETANVVVL